MNEINEVIRKYGLKSVLLVSYLKLADEQMAMPDETDEECIAKAKAYFELERLHLIALNRKGV